MLKKAGRYHANDDGTDSNDAHDATIANTITHTTTTTTSTNTNTTTTNNNIHSTTTT